MATDYDPPTRYDLNEDLGGMSDATLQLLEREMGLNFSDMLSELTLQPRPQLFDPLPPIKEEEKTSKQQPRQPKKPRTVEEKNAKKDKYVKVKRKGGRVELTEEERKEKERRLKEWEDGGNREEREAYRLQHSLIDEKHNEDFFNYYKGLKILPESEWDAFYSKLKEPLDICFRINSVEKNYEKIKEEIDR